MLDGTGRRVGNSGARGPCWPGRSLAGVRQLRVWLAACGLLAGGFIAACGGGPRTSTPTQPTPTTTSTPTTPTPTVDPNLWTIDGRVLQTVANTPVPGATITFPDGLGQVVADASGAFHFESTTKPTLSPSYGVTISAPGYVTRGMALGWSKSSTVTLDVIGDRAPFVLSFYRNLVRDTFDNPGVLRAVKRFTAVPKFYMRRLDTAGKAVEPEVLTSVEASLRKGMTAWTNGRWSIETFELGAEDRQLPSGWVVVEYVRDPSSRYCGLSTVGGPSGRITLYDDRCGCGSVKVPPGVVIHELGHTLGFWHVPQGTGLMSPQASGSCFAETPTAQEQFHAQVAYQRPNGNTDVDNDSVSSTPFQPTALTAID